MRTIINISLPKALAVEVKRGKAGNFASTSEFFGIFCDCGILNNSRENCYVLERSLKRKLQNTSVFKGFGNICSMQIVYTAHFIKVYRKIPQEIKIMAEHKEVLFKLTRLILIKDSQAAWNPERVLGVLGQLSVPNHF